MTGYVYGDVLAELWTSARFVVLPSTMEGLSIALLEAVSYGKCVLISDIPENVEVMEECAPRFESRNVHQLEERLRELLASPELVARYAAMTRERIARRYSWETIVDELDRCYHDVVAGRRPAADHPPADSFEPASGGAASCEPNEAVLQRPA
jgi:glycosyltransferase involved in cell wall biosynthesis